jgi:hypothetical protein
MVGRGRSDDQAALLYLRRHLRPQGLQVLLPPKTKGAMKRAAPKRPRLVACRHPATAVWAYLFDCGGSMHWCEACGAVRGPDGRWRLPARTRSTARGKR